MKTKHATVTLAPVASLVVNCPKGSEDDIQPTKLRARSLAKSVRARLRASGEGGQTLLEFALCMPILLLIVTGIMTFGIALNNYVELTSAVNIGARRLAISRGQTTDPCATTAAVVYQASLLNSANLNFTFVLNGVTYSGATCSSTSITQGAAGNMVQGSAAQVRATYPCTLSIYGVNYAPSCTMTAQTTELIQ